MGTEQSHTLTNEAEMPTDDDSMPAEQPQTRPSDAEIPSLPSEQWAQVLESKGSPPIYKRIPVPQPSADQVLVHVLFSGVCHSDLHIHRADWSSLNPSLPLTGGHEGAGIVVARGQLVTTIPLGARVGIKWINSSCLSCSFCHRGLEQLCPRAKMSGYSLPGTFQQYALAQASHLARIPDECAHRLAEVAPVLCAGITVYRGLKSSGVIPGQTVAVVGAGGGLGSMAVQYARAMGLDVIAVDSGSEKREACERLGAVSFVDFRDEADVVAAVKAASSDGLGPDAVLLTAVGEEPFRQATLYVRPAGTVVAVGLPPGAQFSAPVLETVLRMVTIRGSYVANRADTAEALDFFRRGLIHAPVTIVGLSDLPRVFRLMEEGKIVGRYVLDTSR
ncbi:alcohol dehydrogenase 1 [Ophiocordyceps camponoti-floridani]|uniref:alcohol dehydrogenase n=1 Tax=Ophiocordyceps camponoti-floridani TaxID=2030778 RepID=A0A8H4Q1V4_9HYPO|nr:alcohol dehydrogenase 1 [Ophiocordyceps camponoti-floridani]